MYTVALCTWFFLRLQFGDTLPWLALANAFALYLFAPLVLLVPLVLFARRLVLLPFLLLPLALFLFLFGAQFLPHSPRRLPDQPTLRVMTFNVFGNSNQPELATTVVESENPDLILIQELSPRHSYDLTGQLGKQYPYHQFEPLYGRRGIGVLSRYPIESRGWLKLGRDPYAAQQVTLKWKGQTINVINVHLESTMPGEDVNTSFRERETQVRQLLELISGEHVPTIVAGDLNLTDTTQAYSSLATRLKDAHRNAGWGLGLTFPTNPEFVRSILAAQIARLFQTRPNAVFPWLQSVNIPPCPLLRIDYILTTSELTATNAHVAQWDGQSDHRAVIAELQLNSIP